MADLDAYRAMQRLDRDYDSLDISHPDEHTFQPGKRTNLDPDPLANAEVATGFAGLALLDAHPAQRFDGPGLFI